MATVNASGCVALVTAGLLGLFGSSIASADPGQDVIADRCTNQIDYAGDPRSNAEINGIGANTGRCPAPMTAGGTSPAAPSTRPTAPAVGDSTDRAFLTKLVNAGIAIPTDEAAKQAITIAHQGCEFSQSSSDPIAVTQKVVAANRGVEPGIVSRVLGSGIMHYCPEVLAGVPLR